jgi:hypothetical protein
MPRRTFARLPKSMTLLIVGDEKECRTRVNVLAQSQRLNGGCTGNVIERPG